MILVGTAAHRIQAGSAGNLGAAAAQGMVGKLEGCSDPAAVG